MTAVTSIATIADLRAQMNWGDDPTYDVEGAKLLASAVAIVERLSGHTIGATFTQVFDDVCGDPMLILPETPIYSITSLVEYHGPTAYTLTNQPVGQAVDYYGYTIDDAEGGLVTRRGAYSARSGFGSPVQVTWVAGRGTVPAPILSATLELVQHLWDRSQVGSSRPAFNDDSNIDTYAPTSRFAVPRSITELLSPYLRVPGIG